MRRHEQLLKVYVTGDARGVPSTAAAPGVVEFLERLLRAGRTLGMRDAAFELPADIAFERFPLILSGADTSAPGADRQQPAQLIRFRLSLTQS